MQLFTLNEVLYMQLFTLNEVLYMQIRAVVLQCARQGHGALFACCGQAVPRHLGNPL